MTISVINITEGALSDEQLHRAIRAINRQIAEDFAPYWGFGAQLRLEGKTGATKAMTRAGHKPRANFDQADMRGDAVLYVHDLARIRDADGYHTTHHAGIPYGFVFLELSQKLKEDWTVTLSHEALELLGDPENNLLVQGPHPKNPDRLVYHWFEVCDAVQAETYEIDGVQVSNFVLPLYFTSSAERGGRNDFLGTQVEGRSLRSFSVNPGGYLNFFDPKRGKDVQFSADKLAEQRLAIKAKLKTGRGHARRRRALS